MLAALKKSSITRVGRVFQDAAAARICISLRSLSVVEMFFLPAAKPSRSYRAPIFFYLGNERVFLVALNLLTTSSKSF